MAGAQEHNSTFTRIGEPTNSEEERASHSLLCEFNQSQTEEGCSERWAFRWLKEDRPKHGICPHKTDHCDRSKELKEEMNRHKTILRRLRHGGDCSDERLREHEAQMKLAGK